MATDISFLQGIEDTRKYKSLIESLYELQDWFHVKYPTYLMRIDIDHNKIHGAIFIRLKWFVESFSIGQIYAITGERWIDPIFVDTLTRTFASVDYRDALIKSIANKILKGPDEVRKYEDEVEAYEQGMLKN